MVLANANSVAVWRGLLAGSSSPNVTDQRFMYFQCNTEAVLNILGGNYKGSFQKVNAKTMLGGRGRWVVLAVSFSISFLHLTSHMHLKPF